MTTSVSPRGCDAVAQAVVEQLAPLLHLRAELADALPVTVDLDSARRRRHAGRSAFDPQDVLDAAGDLSHAFRRAVATLDMAGLVSSAGVAEVRRRAPDVHAQIAAWVAGEQAPREAARHVAWRAASLVGNAVLRRAAAAVRHDDPTDAWPLPTCPCCGGAPDFALMHEHGRTLICARCDTGWPSAASGCLGCGASDAPTIAHVRAAFLGYRMTICNSCGRYLKERPAHGDYDPLVERALTAELDEAAERRGLRL